MKHYFNYAIYLLIGLAIGAFLWRLYDIRSESQPSDEIIRIDTIRKTDSIYVPVPYPSEIIKPVFIPEEIDTVAIIADYYSKIVYDKDTLINTSNLIVSVTDTISENRKTGRSVYYTLQYPEITRQRKIKDRLNINADTRGVVNLSWQRNRFVFSGGYDVVNNKPVIGFGYNLFER